MSSSLVSGAAVNTTTTSGGFDDICALSPLQQEIFSDPNHAEYVEQALWTNRWALDDEMLKRSWDLLAQRHPILRTVFRQARKQAVQIVRGNMRVALVIHNLKHEAEAAQQEIFQRTIRQELMVPLDLGKGPLFRVNVFRLADDSFKTLLTFHPILMDRQSVELVHLEFSAIYESLVKDNLPPEVETPSIKDFILWLKRQDTAEASRYWEQTLNGAFATHLLLDHPQSAEEQIYANCVSTFSLDLTLAVNALAAQCGVSVPVVLKSGWALLLARYTGAADVCFGWHLNGRASGLSGNEKVAGKFAHTLPVRVQLRSNETVMELLHSLQQQIININRHCYLPLGQIAVAVPSSEKLFNTVFKEPVNAARRAATDLQFLSVHAADRMHAGLTVEVVQEEALQVSISFREGACHPAIAQSLLASFQQLIEEMAAKPHCLVAELELVPANERARILAFGQGIALGNKELWQSLGVAKPGSGAALYILDGQQRLLPVGCAGEIAACVSDAESSSGPGKFVSNPFVPAGNTRLYLTGRRGRWKCDGTLDLLNPETQISQEDAAPGGFVAPVTDIEKLVAQVWQEVLCVSQAGLKDDFFDLGGHSLNTIQIRSRLSQRLGINVPLKTIFANTGLEAQARAVAALVKGVAQPGSGIPRLPQKKHYPVSHAQRRLWFLHRLDPDDRFYHTADYIVLEGPLNQPAFEQAFHALVERQEILRTSFTLVADEPVQRISTNTLTFPFHDLSALAPDEQTQTMKRLQDEVPKWLSDLEVPPVGALLVKLADDKHVFILAIHHILSDEWSGQVVWRDLMELYSAACRKERPNLPEVRIRYADFAVWQKERIEGGKLAESERYWLARLSGEIPKLKLPMVTSQNGKQETDLLNEVIESGPELAEQLVRIAQAQDATPFMVKLALFKAFLARITGQNDILLGSTTAGRDHPDIEPLIGLFVNVVALRTDLGGNPKFSEILSRVKQSCVEAYAHQEYPFDLLVQRLAPAREAGQLPLLQAFFADIPQSESKIIEGLRFTPIDVSNGMAAGVGGRKLPVGLGMVCHDGGGGKLTWRFLFRADHFAVETAQRLARQFKAFLVNLAENPDARLSEIQTVCRENEIPLERITDRKEFPLSFNQRDMWFQRQIHTEAGLNNLGALITLSGPLDVEFFRLSLQAVVERHDTLRTVFVERSGVPYQNALAAMPVAIPVVDLRGKSEEEQAEIVQRRRREVIGGQYDFSAGPLFRTELLRLQEDKHVLIFAFSHLILDGVYMAELFEQLAVAYELLLKGQPAVLPPLKLQYQDFATWQDERLKQGLLEHHQSYWQQQLQSPLPAMSLPSDKDTRTVRSFELEFTQWPVRTEVFKGLKTFRKRYRTTMFRTVLAAFEVLLRKIIGEKELLLGVPFSSLPAGVSQTLGFFGHAVPVRITLDDRQPFTQVLSDVNKTIGLAQEHLEYPLCEAVRGMQINRDPQRPLFPVVVSQVKDLDLTMGELRMSMDLRPVHAGVYHLWLTILESRDALQLGFYYNREVLEGRPLAMIQECLNELLAQIAANPEAPIGELGIVSGEERAKVLAGLAGAISSPTAESKGIVARIEHHAEARPHARAAVCGSAELNYQQLNLNANRLANWLRGQGIGRESRVGIFGTRGLEMLTTLLAVLKSGAAFVPLDPEHPDLRINNILGRAKINVLATSADLVIRGRELAAGTPTPPHLICWHDIPEECGVPNPSTWASQPDSNPGVINGLRDLAYVCHTSGSTGIPKGAMVEHRGMLNHLLAKINLLGLDHESVVAQNASHCFDISIWQFFAALLAGGQVVIYPPEALFHPGSMLALVEQDGVTVLETVPSLLEMMLNEMAATVNLPRLRHLVSNAELLPVPLSRRWAQRFPHVALVNTYGATECSDDTTHHFVQDLSAAVVRIPVGQSIAGAQHYVLDHELKPLPAGCIGQIAIAGDVVGRGYLASPAATARTFVPDPFRSDGSRLYLTGDLGRWNSAGELDFVGRTDNQVKVHGHRVELTEIEAALARVPGLRQVVVVVSDEQESQRLLAYWVGDANVDGNMLRNHARKELPAYMVPNAFIQMPALPLTSNGKVDRRALPKPTENNASDFVPPRDEVEFKVARLWKDELSISAVGVFDNFFERGGHSLKAVSLINRLQGEFKISLPLRTLFDHQTIDSLSRVIRERCQNSSPLSGPAGRLVSLQAGNPSSLPLFIVHPHGGTVFCYQALVAALGDQFPVFGIQCRGLEEGEEPLASITDMAAEYIKDIRIAQPEGPYQIAGWSLGGPIAFEVARQLESAGSKVALLGIFDSAIPASSGKGLEQLLPPSMSEADFSSEMSMASFARWFFRADEKQFEGLNDAQIVNALKEMAQRAGMLPPDVSPAMLQRFVAVAISSGLALFHYQPANPVQTNVVLFRAAQSLVDDPQWWAPWTHGSVETIAVTGSHYDMVFPPAVQTLAAALKEKLSEPGGARGSGI
ncbi:MAG TPA: amino acid adenylation domain-containing protein [Candidatus Angelobacter sp.]|nr:amino acid adenylation domain-containing protein [Candidatus Angelobacter sp.]